MPRIMPERPTRGNGQTTARNSSNSSSDLKPRRPPCRKLVPVKFRLPPETYDAEPPPVLGSWRNVYIFVIAWLALLIVVFYFFTRYFA
jgi:hypothetical protein